MERETETNGYYVGAKKMNREIVGQEQHLLDSDCTVCVMLLEGSSPKAFLTTDGGWKHAAETKWADASRLK
jgi:hypothetical protein